MSEFQRSKSVAVVLALLVFSGCSERNPRTVTKIDEDAGLNGSLPWRPEDGRVITLWVDPNNSTMSTLYGNEVAVEAARSTTPIAYPSGTAIALVTWKQKENERWFGASIPGAVESAEFVTITTTAEHRPRYHYQRFSGNPLRDSEAEEMSTPRGRMEYLLSQGGASMP